MNKEKISCRKKVMLSCLSILMIFSMVGANILNIFALSKNDIVTTWLPYISNYTNSDGIAHFGQMQKIMINGKHGFCVQPSVLVGNGEGYINSTHAPTSLESKIMYHGFYNASMSDYDYVVTFNMIQEQHGARVTSTTIPNYEVRKSEIMKLVNSHDLRPNFKTTNVEVNLGESITLVDSYNVISQMKLHSNTANVDCRVEGNKLIITPKIDSNENGVFIFSKFKQKVEMNYLYTHPTKQDVLVGGAIDPINLRLTIKVNKYIDVTLNKEDLEIGKQSQGDATLIGAEYSLFESDGTFLEKKLIGEDLALKFEKLLCSKEYYIQETKEPNGYTINGEKIVIKPLELIQNGIVGSDLQYETVSKDKVIKGNIAIFKTITEGESGLLNPTPNVEFTMKLKSEIAKVGWDNAKTYTAITGIDGFAHFKDVPFGIYEVRETKSPSETVPSKPFEVTVSENGKTVFRAVNNTPFKSWLKIYKRDIDGNKVTLSNATFSLKDKDGKLVKQKVGDDYISKFNTNDKGEVTLPLMLKSGKYTVHEIEVPNGFIRADKVEVVISREGDYIINADHEPVTEVEVVNEKPNAKIIVNKTYEREEDNGIGGTVFQLKTNSKIVNPTNNEVIFEKGDVVNVDGAENGLYTVNEIGRLEIDNLPIGTGEVSYILKEYSTLDGYVLDDEEYVFTFKQDDIITKEYMQEMDIQNVQTKVEVVKKDLDTKENLKGVSLELLNKDGEVLDTWVSDGNGRTFKGLLVGEEYTIHEVKALDNYLNTSDVTFVVKNIKEVQEIIIYNQKKEVPKKEVETSDKTNSRGLLAMLGVSFIVISSVVMLRKKKEVNVNEKED